jgi:hypothetical protein
VLYTVCILSANGSFQKEYGMKFCFTLGKIAAATHVTFRLAFEEDTVSRTQTCDWFSNFRSGVTSINAEHLVCPSTRK